MKSKHEEAVLWQFITITSQHEIRFLSENVSLLENEYKKGLAHIERMIARLVNFEHSLGIGPQQQSAISALLKEFSLLKDNSNK